MLADKWVTVDSIMERVTRVHPDIALDRAACAEWCFDVVRDLGVWPGFEEVLGQVLPVVNSRVELPCNVYRVIQAMPANQTSYTTNVHSKFRYENRGDHLLIQNSAFYNLTDVTVHMLLFVVDDDGYPKIFEAAREAAYFYIITKMKYNDFLEGKIAPAVYQSIRDDYDKHLAKARSATMRWTSNNEMDRIVRVARSMVRPVHRQMPS